MNQSNEIKDIINSIGEAVFIQYPENGIIYDINNTMLEMYGFERDEVIGQSVEKLSCAEHGFTIDKVRDYFETVKLGDKVLFEWKAKKKDGSTFWVEVSLKISTLNNKEWLVAVIRDISNKKENEIQLQVYAYFGQLLAELSTKFISLAISDFEPEINNALSKLGNILFTDRSYIFQYNNNATLMSNTYEWCNDGIISFKDELQNLPCDCFKWHNSHLLKGKPIIIKDVELMTNDCLNEKLEFKREGIQSVLIVPFLKENQLIGFIGVDAVSEKREWSTFDIDALRAFGNVIGQAMVRRDYEQKLTFAKNKAEESDRLKSAFLSNMSHEIRTPMNGILGFSDLLIEGDVSQDEQVSYLKIINNSSNQLLSIINDIIDISKIEAGQVKLTLSEFNIIQLIEELHQFFQPNINEKGINFELINQISNHSSMIYSDEVKVRQILINLINNAIKFTPEGTIKIKASIQQFSVVVLIDDTGVGMDEETQKIIFNRFRRADDNFSNSVGGTGLGLAISKAYATKLGGDIKVKSKKGAGSMFTFHIPTQCLNN